MFCCFYQKEGPNYFEQRQNNSFHIFKLSISGEKTPYFWWLWSTSHTGWWWQGLTWYWVWKSPTIKCMNDSGNMIKKKKKKKDSHRPKLLQLWHHSSSVAWFQLFLSTEGNSWHWIAEGHEGSSDLTTRRWRCRGLEHRKSKHLCLQTLEWNTRGSEVTSEADGFLFFTIRFPSCRPPGCGRLHLVVRQQHRDATRWLQ